MSELDKKMIEYGKKFNDGFPMIPLGWGKSEDELIEIINECLKKGKDVYELGYVKDDMDLMY